MSVFLSVIQCSLYPPICSAVLLAVILRSFAAYECSYPFLHQFKQYQYCNTIVPNILRY